MSPKKHLLRFCAHCGVIRIKFGEDCLPAFWLLNKREMKFWIEFKVSFTYAPVIVIPNTSSRLTFKPNFVLSRRNECCLKSVQFDIRTVPEAFKIVFTCWALVQKSCNEMNRGYFAVSAISVLLTHILSWGMLAQRRTEVCFEWPRGARTLACVTFFTRIWFHSLTQN